jgi:rhodanese-related sulfurtransferase
MNNTLEQNQITAKELFNLIKKDPDIVVIDVRTPEECAAGKIPGAKNIDIFDPEFPNKIQDLPKKEAIYVVCRSGNRSGQACAYLNSNGFYAINVSDGMIGWNNNPDIAID